MAHYNSINYGYAEAVLAAGGLPLFIPIVPEGVAKEYLEDYRLDGIIFSGGADVAPRFYGEDPGLQIPGIDTKRDIMEFELLEEAVKRKIPVLGICRGHQLINVAFDGTLYQDIDTEVQSAMGHHPSQISRDELFHSVSIKKESVLHDIFGDEKIYVNSFHHQAVKKLGRGLKATAFSCEGIVEAFETVDMNERFVLGIQWHPENLVNRYNEFLGIFKLLVDRAKEK
ncbi:gamma-glutamyl-gamma-aminobutyrate hydrolase family protein [Fusobacterium ulcerans]|uniref:gamma-glutamyl-gamma-aminobutyrate hydrolase family protein n=1 Tax=Fusobacterium ulcerans TaxID=861 RepID=UPI00267349E2|nr:gamma-glutamyl-gamma-aminobutyrate hydrolase family protein [Fusobacterium ulcerans]